MNFIKKCQDILILRLFLDFIALLLISFSIHSILMIHISDTIKGIYNYGAIGICSSFGVSILYFIEFKKIKEQSFKYTIHPWPLNKEWICTIDQEF